MPTATHNLGLSLSGGGYRATAFHLGTLKKLQKMKLLSKVDVMSTISGGSIIGAYYCLHKDNFETFEKDLYDALLKKNVISKLLGSITFFQLLAFAAVFILPSLYFLFYGPAWLFPVLWIIMIFLIYKFQFRIFPVSERIQKIYDSFFYKGAALKNLPETPVLVIGATNLQTGRPFTFSRNWMQDSTYQYRQPRITFKSSDFPLSKAVMASTCVPFAFNPIHIGKEYFTNEADANIVHPILVDGGVYDNQGIHKIVQEGQYACQHVITSDAGGGHRGEYKILNAFNLLLVTVDVFMDRIKKAEMQENIYSNTSGAYREVAYFSLAWDVERLIPGFIDNLEKKQITASVINALKLQPEWVENPDRYRPAITNYLERVTDYSAIEKPTPEEKSIARNVGTNLTSLTKQQLDCLIKQASCLTEMQVKLYCPDLLDSNPV